MKKEHTLPKSKAKTAYGLLSEIRKLILAEPKRYDQTWWLWDRKKRKVDDVGEPPAQGFPSCGTVACVAGWVVALKMSRLPPDWAIEDRAGEILGLDTEQIYDLFDSAAAGVAPSQSREHAEAGAAHIAKFQETHARQLKAKAV